MAILLQNDGSDLTNINAVETSGTITSNGTYITHAQIGGGFDSCGLYTDSVSMPSTGAIGYWQFRVYQDGISLMMVVRKSAGISYLGNSNGYRTNVGTPPYTHWNGSAITTPELSGFVLNQWYDGKCETISNGKMQHYIRVSDSVGLSNFIVNSSSWTAIGTPTTSSSGDYTNVDFLIATSSNFTATVDIGFIVLTDDGTIPSAAGGVNHGNNLSTDLSIDMSIKQGI